MLQEKNEEFITELKEVSDSYDDFVDGVLAYINNKSERLEKVKQFMANHPQALTSDIMKFISEQKDLFDDMEIKPMSAQEIYAHLAEARACYERGDYRDFDEALDEISKEYGL